jgi:hypothetical protein
MLTLGCRLRIGLRKPELPLRWSLRLRAIPCTVPCQGFHFPTFRASHHAFDLESAISLSRGCFVKEKLGQLWSMGTRTFQKVVWCSISVTGIIGSPAGAWAGRSHHLWIGRNRGNSCPFSGIDQRPREHACRVLALDPTAYPHGAAQTRIVSVARIPLDPGNLSHLSKGYFATTFLSSNPRSQVSLS